MGAIPPTLMPVYGSYIEGQKVIQRARLLLGVEAEEAIATSREISRTSLYWHAEDILRAMCDEASAGRDWRFGA